MSKGRPLYCQDLIYSNSICPKFRSEGLSLRMFCRNRFGVRLAN